MTCDIVWHKKLPANVVADVMESWVPNLNIGRLIQNKSMSVNMFGVNMLVPPCDSPPPRAEVSRECGPGELMRRVKRLEDALSTAAESRAAEMETERMEVDRQFAKLRKQLRDQEDRISELESSNAKLKASCTTVDAASQTDPTPSQEYEVPTAALDAKKDASCDAQSNNPEAEDNVTNEDQAGVLPHTKPKRKRKPRKNRSRGARSRAKAAAALALLEAETVTSTLSTKDSPVPDTEAIATLILTESKVAALVSPMRDISIPVVEVAALSRVTEEIPVPVTDVDQTSAADPGPATPAEDRRCVILPVKDHSSDHRLQPGGMYMKNLFQGFRPPLVDPCRLSRWFQVTKLDPWMWRI
jgi:hypothetical protein